MKSKIKDIINSSNSIVLLAHENPDGDAIGSLIAFYRVLRNMGKDVDVIAKGIPKRFNYLGDIDKIIGTSNREYDLGIILDCATEERIGQDGKITDRCKETISIDHHVGNTKYADINYIEGETSSCSQVLFYLFKEWEFSIDKDTAIALMTGLLTDTNGFKNDNVDRYSFLMATEIMDMGTDIYNLQREILTKINLPQHELMKITLNRLEFFLDGKIAFSYITKDDMIKCGAEIGDHEGLVELGRNIEGVEVSIFMREDDGYRISLRSNGKVDVCSIALNLGGNGHKMAAGVKIKKDFKETKNLIINETIRIISL